LLRGVGDFVYHRGNTGDVIKQNGESSPSSGPQSSGRDAKTGDEQRNAAQKVVAGGVAPGCRSLPFEAVQIDDTSRQSSNANAVLRVHDQLQGDIKKQARFAKPSKVGPRNSAAGGRGLLLYNDCRGL